MDIWKKNNNSFANGEEKIGFVIKQKNNSKSPVRILAFHLVFLSYSSWLKNPCSSIKSSTDISTYVHNSIRCSKVEIQGIS